MSEGMALNCSSLFVHSLIFYHKCSPSSLTIVVQGLTSTRVSIPPAHVNTPLYLCRGSWGLQSQPISLLVQLHALLFRWSCAVWDHAGRAARGAFVQQHQRPAGIHHLVNIWWINADLITFYSLVHENITFLEVILNQLVLKIVLWRPLLAKLVITPTL